MTPSKRRPITIFQGHTFRFLISLALIGVLLVLQACSASRGSCKTRKDELAYSVAQQKRINRYFHEKVVPNLGACWSRLAGNGAVEMTYRYENDAKGAWTFKNVELGESTLPTGVATSALDCMRKAASGTSFARDQYEQGDSYVLHWTWPVPFPPNAKELEEAMYLDNGGSGTTDCDGNGTAPKCMKCSSNETCKKVCVGFPSCTINATPKWTTCSSSGACASGGPFGVVGGTRVIF